MRSRSDGHDRRRGRSPEQLEKHLRELRVAWETNHCETQPEDEAEWPAVGVHRDNDEERSARVEAMLETLQATNNTAGNAIVRSKIRNTRRRVGAKG